MIDVVIRVEGASIHFPSLLDGPSSQQPNGRNNFVYTRDYAFINQVSPSGRHDIVKEIDICMCDEGGATL